MKLEAGKLAALAAVIRSNLTVIERLHTQLIEVALALQEPIPSFRDMAAVAYLLHNVYNALENSFEQISRTFENHVTIPDQWHKELLDKMFLEIPEIRPAVLPNSLKKLLNNLRGFRHLFRHSYNFELDPERLRLLLREWTAQQHELTQAFENFGAYLLKIKGN